MFTATMGSGADDMRQREITALKTESIDKNAQIGKLKK